MVDDQRLRLEVLLEISLAVGAELDLKRMLSNSLLVMLRRLDCTFGSVVLDGARGEAVRVALPRSARVEQTLAGIEAVRPADAPDGSATVLDGRYFHRWSIPGHGTLVLGRREPLPDVLTFDLRAIMDRLAAAVSASLQNQSLIDATRALEDSRQRWMFAVEGSGSGVCDWNPLTDAAHYSERWHAILGDDDSTPEARGRAFFERVHPEHVEDLRAAIRRHFSGGPPVGLECKVRHARGHDIWVEVKGLAVHWNATQRVDRLIATVSDITRRKNVEFRLQQEHNVLRTLVDSLPDLVWIKDQSERYVMCNPRTLAFHGRPETEVIGRTIEQFGYSERFVAAVRAADRRVLEGGESVVREVDATFSSDGHRETLEVTLVPLRGLDSELVGLLGIAHDVTVRKQAEVHLLRSNEEMERAVRERTAELEAAKLSAEASSRAKSVFLANMSHELRTPLHGILGTVHLIRDDCARPPAVVEHAGRVERSAKHLLGIINEVLDVARIESGRMALHDDVFTLEQIVQTVEGIFRSSAALKALDFSVTLDPDVARLSLRGDELRLQQIITNLVGNAIKFTSQGSVSVRMFLDWVDVPRCRLRVEVEDTGIGIPGVAQERLFEPFEQADSGLARKHGGSGLGLNISRRLAEMMGGGLTFSSEEGVGTVFHLQVQVEVVDEAARDASAPASAGQTAEAQLDRYAGRRILVVDDDEIGRFVVSSYLRARGIVVEEADGGHAAVSRGRSSPFDLVLMDMQMPDMDGLAATRALREQGANMHTPIIALTANALADDRDACINAGMNDFLTKPIDWSQLARVMGTWNAEVP